MAQRNTFDSSLLHNPLVVLRKIDLDAIDKTTMEIVGKSMLAFKYPERNLIWFADGYVLNDQPRQAEASKELIAATEHFAIGRTDTQAIMADNLTLHQAEQAVRGAKISLDLHVDLDRAPLPAKPVKAGKGQKIVDVELAGAGSEA